MLISGCIVHGQSVFAILIKKFQIKNLWSPANHNSKNGVKSWYEYLITPICQSVCSVLELSVFAKVQVWYKGVNYDCISWKRNFKTLRLSCIQPSLFYFVCQLTLSSLCYGNPWGWNVRIYSMFMCSFKICFLVKYNFVKHVLWQLFRRDTSFFDPLSYLGKCLQSYASIFLLSYTTASNLKIKGSFYHSSSC